MSTPKVKRRGGESDEDFIQRGIDEEQRKTLSGIRSMEKRESDIKKVDEEIEEIKRVYSKKLKLLPSQVERPEPRRYGRNWVSIFPYDTGWRIVITPAHPGICMKHNPRQIMAKWWWRDASVANVWLLYFGNMFVPRMGLQGDRAPVFLMTMCSWYLETQVNPLAIRQEMSAARALETFDEIESSLAQDLVAEHIHDKKTIASLQKEMLRSEVDFQKAVDDRAAEIIRTMWMALWRTGVSQRRRQEAAAGAKEKKSLWSRKWVRYLVGFGIASLIIALAYAVWGII
jgi:hypothetical protein